MAAILYLLLQGQPQDGTITLTFKGPKGQLEPVSMTVDNGLSIRIPGHHVPDTTELSCANITSRSGKQANSSRVLKRMVSVPESTIRGS